jgi:hypothetical protein
MRRNIMSRIKILNRPKIKTKTNQYRFPIVGFRGVFVPLHDASYLGAIGTNALGRRPSGTQTSDKIAVSFRVTASPDGIEADYRTTRVLCVSRRDEVLRDAASLDPDELNTIKILMRILGDEWKDVYGLMRLKYRSAALGIGRGEFWRLADIHDVKGMMVKTIRGYVELQPDDYGEDPPLEFKPAERTPTGTTGPITAQPNLGHMHSTHGWDNRKGGC